MSHTETRPAHKPLAGIRVIDASRVLAGPYCGQLLADMGADVIKIEAPGGDENRNWAPLVNGESASFLAVNRGKRGTTINLQAPEGRELLDQLVSQADVLLHNFLPKTAARLGIDPDALLAKYPRLIVCSISAFGARGPWRERPGYDGILQAFSGLMAVTGDSDRPPVRVGASIIDMSTGLIAFGGVMTALFARVTGGGERHVQTSLLESGISLMGFHAVGWLGAGVLPRREGSSLWNLAPYQAFQCADGEIMTGALNDSVWRKLCDVVERPDLRDDPRYAAADQRVVHRDVLVPIFVEIFRTRTADAWSERLDKAGVAYSRINSLNHVFAHEQTQANDMAVTAARDDGTSMPLVGLPFKLGADSQPAPNAPPLLGEHTDAVLREWLNLDAADIERLHAIGAV